jgi:hypothetical protein
MHLDGIRCPALETARENHGTHHQMVGQSQVRRRHGADRSDIGVEVVVECLALQRKGYFVTTLARPSCALHIARLTRPAIALTPRAVRLRHFARVA